MPALLCCPLVELIFFRKNRHEAEGCLEGHLCNFCHMPHSEAWTAVRWPWAVRSGCNAQPFARSSDRPRDKAKVETVERGGAKQRQSKGKANVKRSFESLVL